MIFFEHVLLYNLKGIAGGAEDLAPLERSEVVRNGRDCVIFTYSRMRWTVMQAVAKLETEVRLCDSNSRASQKFKPSRETTSGSPLCLDFT